MSLGSHLGFIFSLWLLVFGFSPVLDFLWITSRRHGLIRLSLAPPLTPRHRRGRGVSGGSIPEQPSMKPVAAFYYGDLKGFFESEKNDGRDQGGGQG